MNRYPLDPYPTGWFKVAFADELSQNKVVTLHFFGQDVIAYRDAAGNAVVQDPYCPHLGAHLGVKSSLRNGVLRCPFHGWKFAGSGECLEIPACKNQEILKKATLKTWQVCERNGFVYAWYDRQQRQPYFDLPHVAEAANGEWTRLRRLRWRAKVHIQEIVENAVDLTHFAHLHEYLEVPKATQLLTEKHLFRVQAETKRPFLGREFVSNLQITYHGLGCVVAPVQSNGLQFLALLNPTPIDEEHVQFDFGLMMRKTKARVADGLLARLALRDVKRELDRDFEVWEKKCYHTRPLLTPEERPILQIRKWASQFYGQSKADHKNASPTFSVA